MSFTQALSKIQFLSRNQIKYIAMFTMLIDHITQCFIPSDTTIYFILHSVIGRCAFPLFVFLMIDGMLRTHHLERNICLLAIFAIITEPLFDYMLYGNFFSIQHQNVLFLYLAFGFFILLCRKTYTEHKVFKIIRIVIIILFGIALAILARILHLDYGFYGMLSLIIGYYLQQRFHFPLLTIVFIAIVESFATGLFSYLIPVAVILLYKPDKPCEHTKLEKYSCYAFYPVHIGIIDILSVFVQ